MPDMIHNIVYQFAKQLREIYGDELKKVVVYGSYARGDYQKNSDVDIMILVDADDYEIKKRFNLVCDLAFCLLYTSSWFFIRNTYNDGASEKNVIHRRF